MCKKLSIILFDGECNFCSKSINFIIKYESSNKFYFASLQSTVGKQLLDIYKLPLDLSTMVFLEGKKSYTKSSAILHIAKQLRFFWPFFYILILLPISLRDYIYVLIAKNRYRILIKKDDTCKIPHTAIARKFLTNLDTFN